MHDLTKIIQLAKEIRVIAIGGVSGTGKGTSGPLIAKALGYRYYATGDAYRKRAEELKMSLTEFAAYAAENPEEDYRLDGVLYRMARSGNWVFDGRLPAIIIPDAEDVCRVLFTCPDVVRFKRIARRANIGLMEAAKTTKAREIAYAEQYQRLYKLTDVTHPKHYDFSIPTENHNPQEVAERTVARIAQHVEGIPSERTCFTPWEPVEAVETVRT